MELKASDQVVEDSSGVRIRHGARELVPEEVLDLRLQLFGDFPGGGDLRCSFHPEKAVPMWPSALLQLEQLNNFKTAVIQKFFEKWKVLKT